MNRIQFFANKNCSRKADPTNTGHKPATMDLFELKIWLVDIGSGQREWCGKLHNLSTGETHHFKGWPGLVASLQDILTPFAQLEMLRSLLPSKPAGEAIERLAFAHF